MLRVLLSPPQRNRTLMNNKNITWAIIEPAQTRQRYWMGIAAKCKRFYVIFRRLAGGASTGEHLLPSDPLLAGIPGFSLLKRTFSLYVELGVCHQKKLMH